MIVNYINSSRSTKYFDSDQANFFLSLLKNSDNLDKRYTSPKLIRECNEVLGLENLYFKNGAILYLILIGVRNIFNRENLDSEIYVGTTWA